MSDKTSEERRGGAFSSFSLSWRRRRKRRERRGSRLVFRRSKEEGKEGEQENNGKFSVSKSSEQGSEGTLYALNVIQYKSSWVVFKGSN